MENILEELEEYFLERSQVAVNDMGKPDLSERELLILQISKESFEHAAWKVGDIRERRE